jgi:hypothetical protein
MTTATQYISQRVTAGTRYANAVTELFAAMVDLGALDRTIENYRAGLGLPQPSFVGDLQDLPRMLAHPLFAPSVPDRARLMDQIRAQADIYISQLT